MSDLPFTQAKEKLSFFLELSQQLQGETPEEMQRRIDVLRSMLDNAPAVIGSAIETVPSARIFSPDALRAFLAAFVVDLILDEGRRQTERR